MTTLQIQKIEKIAAQSAVFAQKALRKSRELEAYLSLLEYRAGKVNAHKSVNALFRKLELP
jgi:hypothetical protein